MILQPSEAAYHQELSAMRQERHVENEMKEENPAGEKLSRDWVLDNFCLRDNPIIKANPKVGEELIQTFQKKG